MYVVLTEMPIKEARKLIYVWAAPPELRNLITVCEHWKFTSLLTKLGGSVDGIVITGVKSLETVEALGLDVRNAGVSYGNLHGHAGLVQIGNRRVTALCAPTLLEMQAGGRAMRFLYHRWMQKFTSPERFMRPHPLVWSDCAEDGGASLEDYLNDPTLVAISIDLETTKEVETIHPETGKYVTVSGVIDLAGYCFAFRDEGGWRFRTVVHDLKCETEFGWLKAVAQSPKPKTFHNGGYDIAYLCRWGCPVRNYLHDTMYWMKSVTPFLSGYYNLASVSTMYLLHTKYWKDGRKATTRHEYKEYCARDCQATAAIMVAQLALTSRYTFENFTSRFYTLPVTHVAEMRGATIDEEVYRRTVEEYEIKAAEAALRVKQLTGGIGHNQSAKLLPLFKGIELVSRKLKTADVQTINGTDKKNSANLSLMHPYGAELVEALKNARRYEKWLNTFLRVELWSAKNNAEGRSQDRKYLFRLDPFGTESGRLSSSSSSFWVGGPGQNIPVELRKVFKAPQGYAYAGTDAPQSETRTTGYISREERLIEVVEGSHDFHSWNASAFFGIHYEEIFDDSTGRKLNKDLRDLSKRVNHGANYNMGAFVLLETIGVSNVRRAQKLLSLPKTWSLLDVCSYLLNGFDTTYPAIRGRWYMEQVQKVIKTGRLLCASGYAPLVLSSPLDSKMDLNSIVSLDPQNLSVVISLKAANSLLNGELAGSGIKYLHQMHDENLCLIPLDKGLTVRDVDAYFEKHCSNRTEFDWVRKTGEKAVMIIPVGETVLGNSWGDMKDDPVPRTQDFLNKLVAEVTGE